MAEIKYPIKLKEKAYKLSLEGYDNKTIADKLKAPFPYIAKWTREIRKKTENEMKEIENKNNRVIKTMSNPDSEPIKVAIPIKNDSDRLFNPCNIHTSNVHSNDSYVQVDSNTYTEEIIKYRTEIIKLKNEVAYLKLERDKYHDIVIRLLGERGNNE